jgi:hypothetical protein
MFPNCVNPWLTRTDYCPNLVKSFLCSLQQLNHLILMTQTLGGPIMHPLGKEGVLLCGFQSPECWHPHQLHRLWRTCLGLLWFRCWWRCLWLLGCQRWGQFVGRRDGDLGSYGLLRLPRWCADNVPLHYWWGREVTLDHTGCYVIGGGSPLLFDGAWMVTPDGG